MTQLGHGRIPFHTTEKRDTLLVAYVGIQMGQQPSQGISRDRTSQSGPLWRLIPYGAFGAVLPSISALATRSEGFTFTPDPNVIVGQVIYIAAAAFLSAIFPYGRSASPFRAALVGIGFPTIVGTAVGAARHAVPSLTSRGGPGEAGSLIGWAVDSFALF
jgi:hypothetical protein